MAIVARGLGLPESGAVVAAGLGTSEPAAAGSISARINGTSSLTAELTAANDGAMTATIGGTSSISATLTATARVVGGWRPNGRRNRFIDFAHPVEMRATLSGSSTLRASLDFTVNFDDELELLLLVGAI